MVRDYILKLQAGEDVRKNLIALKAEAKEYAGKHAILLALNNQVDMFYGFLSDEDPKVRKNAALVLGQLGVQESLSHLYKAYEDENTMFVKSSYLTATGARIVVIAPEGVKILPEQPAAAEMLRQPDVMSAWVPPAAAAEAPYPGRRERRNGSNTVEWNAARNGELQGYNPYTGTMPVAAGAYGSFGGYGF